MALIKHVCICEKRQRFFSLKKLMIPLMTIILSGCSTSTLVQMPEATRPTVSPPQRQDAVGTLLSVAHSARIDGRLDEAESLLSRAMRINPTSPEVYYQMALLRQAQGQTAQVHQLAERALSLGPDAVLARDIRHLMGR